jgi:hypothetical protein
MNPRSEHPHEARRVRLPSGKTIQVVHYGRPAYPPPPDALLHVCTVCSSELVYPTDWREVDRRRWEIHLRCPNCQWASAGVWEHDAVEALDEVLDRGTRTLMGDLRHLARANMEEEVERFSSALRADVILPEDF